MDSSNDVALYSGLGAGIIAVAILVVAVMLYRKNHSEYGVDVIDSSALTGGFQSFNFKTTRQGKKHCHQLHADTRWHPQGQKPASSKTTAAGPPRWLMAFVYMEQHGVQLPYLPRIYTSIINERICPSFLTDLLPCYCEEGDNQSLIDTGAVPSPPRGPHIWLSGNQSPPSDYTGLSHWWINVRGMEQWTSIHFFVAHSNNFCWLCDCGCPGQPRSRHSYYCHWHFWVSASDSHRGDGWSILAAAVTTHWGALLVPALYPRLPQGLGSSSSPHPASRGKDVRRMGGREVVQAGSTFKQVINPI